MQFTDETFIIWVIIPGLIFLARIVDVSVGTLRIIFISKGMRKIASLFGFFESLIWIVAITQMMAHLENFLGYFAWASGFSAGSYVGMWLEERLAMGLSLIQIMTRKDTSELVEHMRGLGYRVTTINAHGAKGPVQIVYSFVYKSDLGKAIETIKDHNPTAFYTIEDIQSVSHGLPMVTEPPVDRIKRYPIRKLKKQK